MQKVLPMEQNWVDRAMRKAQTFKDLVSLAERMLVLIAQHSRHSPVVMICGPMATGDCSVKDNMLFFSIAQQVAAENNCLIWNQASFAQAMIRITRNWTALQKTEAGKSGCSEQIIKEFYEPIFRLGLLGRLYFLPKWEQSVGTKMEKKLAEELRISHSDYPPDWLKEVRRRYAKRKAPGPKQLRLKFSYA